MRILFLPKSPDATAYFRTELPARHLAAAGHDVRTCYFERLPGVADSGIREADVEWADILVVQRPLTEYALGVVRQIKAHLPGKVLVGDYDDDYYAVPSWNPGYTFVKANERHWRALVGEMDGIVVSTDPLAAAIEKRFKGPVEVIANGFDFDTFDSAPLPPPFALNAVRLAKDGTCETVYRIGSEQFNELMRDRVVIAWAGSKFHYADLDCLAPCIPEIMRRHPNVTLLFVGYLQANVLKGAELSRIFTCPGRFPASAFHAMLRGVKIDIMLAPLAVVDPLKPGSRLTMEFNSSKSNLKVMEAMALGAYPVCSRIDPYQDDLDESERDLDEHAAMPRHGTLVPYSKGAWARALDEAIAIVGNPCEHLKWRRENAEYVRGRHAAALRTPLYESFFTKLLETKR